jgi:hypothetical protein
MIAIYILAHLLVFLGLFYGGHFIVSLGLNFLNGDTKFMDATALLLCLIGAVAMVASFASWLHIWP